MNARFNILMAGVLIAFCATTVQAASSKLKDADSKETAGSREGNMVAAIVQAGAVVLADEVIKSTFTRNSQVRFVASLLGCLAIRSYRETAVKLFNGKPELAEGTGYLSMLLGGAALLAKNRSQQSHPGRP